MKYNSVPEKATNQTKKPKTKHQKYNAKNLRRKAD